VLKGLKDGDLVFLGLNKDQLEKQGYGERGSGGGGSSGRGGGFGGSGGRGGGFGGGGGGLGGGGGGTGNSAPIPRGFGH